MRRLINRTAALALCVTVAIAAAAVPCAASDPASPSTVKPATGGRLVHLSPASRQVLAKAPAVPRTRANAQPQPPGGETSSEAFFKSTRGKVTLALMGAGVGFTLWSINHDRKPVKSPVR